MNAQYLDCGEIAIECQIRGITGPIGVKMKALEAMINEEIANERLPPTRAHPIALRYPKREVKFCSTKLKNIQSDVEQIMHSGSEKKSEEVEELRAALYHIMGRLTRIASSKSAASDANKLLIACNRLLECFNNLNSGNFPTAIIEVSMSDINTSVNGDGDAEEESDDSGKMARSKSRITDGSTHNESENENGAGSSGERDNSRANLQTVASEEDRMEVILDKLMERLRVQTDHPYSGRANMAHRDKGSSTSTPFNQIYQRTSNTYNLPPNASNLIQRETQRLHPANSQINRVERRPAHDNLSIYNWKIIFYGDNRDDLPVEKFLYRVENMAKANGITPERLVDNFGVLLKDNALNWYWEHRENFGDVTWRQLHEAMLHRFRIRRTDDDIRQVLESRKQKVKEQFLDFYHKLRSISLTLRSPLSDQELIRLMIRNMRGGLQAFLAGKQFDDISAFVNLCVSVEDTWNRIGWIPELHHQSRRQISALEMGGNDHEDGTGSAKPSEQFEQPDSVCSISYAKQMSNMQGHYQRPVRSVPSGCWNCFSPEHFYKECTSLIRNRFCFGCGAKNIFKPQCLNCNSSYRKENYRGEIRNTGALRSQPSNMPAPRQNQEDTATNTDPEFYSLLKRETSNPPKK